LVLGLVLLGAGALVQAWTTGHAARHQAEELECIAQVRLGLDVFQHLAEERHFYSGNTTPSVDPVLYYDSSRGQVAGQQALALAVRLRKDMERLPLAAERAALDREERDLLLLMAQAQSQISQDRQAVSKVLEGLELAASRGGPSRSYHRLKARCYHALGEDQGAAEEEQRAASASATALDYFLQGEEYRTKSGPLAEAPGGSLGQRPSAPLLQQAIKHYQHALQLEPDNFWCLLQRGRCLLSLGQGPEAVEALGTCVALRPSSPWPYTARGLAQGLLQRYAEAEEDLHRALTLDAKFRPALLHRGILAWLQRKDSQALADFTRVLEPPADQRLIEAAYYRGQLHLERQEFPQALKDFDLVVAANPTFRPVYLSRAQFHFVRDDDWRGLGDLTAFLNLGREKPFGPQDPLLFAQRGRLLHELAPTWRLPGADFQAKLRRVQRDLETARKLGHRSPELFDELGAVAQRLGDWQAALAAYEEALQNAPPDLAVQVHSKRGWIYAQALEPPQHDKARAAFAAALRLDPAHANAHAGLGYLNALRKSVSGAQREATQALWYGAGNYYVVHNVACIYAELAQIDARQAKQHQDLAMALLQDAVNLCRNAGGGTTEIDSIRGDMSLQDLSGRPDFKKLLADNGR
jgi:tetratricopeptide (TPR) repeat protein